MSKRAEEAAEEYFRGSNPYREHPEEEWKKEGFISGYVQAEEDALERAIEWWRPRLCGFLKEGLTEGILDEFRKAMQNNEQES